MKAQCEEEQQDLNTMLPGGVSRGSGNAAAGGRPGVSRGRSPGSLVESRPEAEACRVGGWKLARDLKVDLD